MSGQNPVDVAIIGGGITGLALAIGLQRRNISFKIYERSSSFREIGAGIGFTTNAIHAMNLQSPQILEAFRSVAVQNESDYFNYVDGYNVDTKDPTYEKVIISLDVGKRGMEGCRRSDFLAKMVRLIPSDCVVFEKELVAAVEGVGKVHLSFQDGTTADADVGKSNNLPLNYQLLTK
jgi:2-polyprenyl-6-methoxyphenol hydroxylase-like FAD-dependent oxidoreductase